MMHIHRILRKIRRLSLTLLAITLVLAPFAGAGIGEPKQAFPENDTEGYLPVDVLSIDPAIKDATPDFHFLIMSPEGKETRLMDVSLAIDFLYPGDPGNDALKAELNAKMQDIWDTYPVVFETSPGGRGIPRMAGPLSR
ncbi:MAG: hypothetical protein M0Q92_11615 [Methanoregula sp.]|nr:hypothetical protein [Methanoregula sp.]